MSAADDRALRLRGYAGIRSPGFKSGFSTEDIASVYAETLAGVTGQVNVAGYEVLKQNLSILYGEMLAAAGNISRKGAAQIKELSQSLVPYKDGDLHDSCHMVNEQFGTEEELPPGTDLQVWHWAPQTVKMQGRAVSQMRQLRSYIVYYDAPHAWRLHENPENWKIEPNPPLKAGATPTNPRGRTDHFLQIAYDVYQPQYPAMVAKELGDALKRVPWKRPVAAAAAPAVPRPAENLAPRLRPRR